MTIKMKTNNSKAFLNFFGEQRSDKNQNRLQKTLDLINEHRSIERLLTFNIKSINRSRLTEDFFFLFMISPTFKEINVFDILEEYAFGDKQNDEWENMSKIINTSSELKLNRLIQKHLLIEKKLLFYPNSRAKVINRWSNMLSLKNYSCLYELFSSVLSILVRLNALYNFDETFLTLEKVNKLTTHNKITQLTKKTNIVDWTKYLNFVNNQIRNVTQHFDVSYNPIEDIFVGHTQKGKPFEISSSKLETNYLDPLNDFIISFFCAIILLTLTWMKPNMSRKYIRQYAENWEKDNEKKLRNNYLKLELAVEIGKRLKRLNLKEQKIQGNFLYRDLDNMVKYILQQTNKKL